MFGKKHFCTIILRHFHFSEGVPNFTHRIYFSTAFFAFICFTFIFTRVLYLSLQVTLLSSPCSGPHVMLSDNAYTSLSLSLNHAPVPGDTQCCIYCHPLKILIQLYHHSCLTSSQNINQAPRSMTSVVILISAHLILSTHRIPNRAQFHYRVLFIVLHFFFLRLQFCSRRSDQRDTASWF